MPDEISRLPDDFEGACCYSRNSLAAIHSAHKKLRVPKHGIASSVGHSILRLSDPAEFTHAVAGATMKVDFLAPQREAVRIERFADEDWAIHSYEAGVKARMCGPLLPGWVAVCLVLRSGVSRLYGTEMEEGYLLCNPPDVPIDGFIAPGFHAVSTSITLELWEECQRVSGSVQERMEGFQVIPLSPETFRRLLASWNAARSCLSGDDEDCARPSLMGAGLSRALATVAWENIARHRIIDGSPRNRFRLARRAEAWMRDRLAEPFSVPEVCLALGVSRRELEYSFHAAFGESPRAFLESLRMNAVRTALKRAGDGRSVTDVVLAHGFNHLGRFAERYRLMFGERPSETTRGYRRG
jgi:AraC-like DNA-binding protein